MDKKTLARALDVLRVEPSRPAGPVTAAADTGLAQRPHHSFDPLAFAAGTLRFSPEPQQLPVFTARSSRGILCCNRQWGKSTTIAVLAAHRAFWYPDSLLVVVSRTLRQSNELVRKIRRFLRAAGIKTQKDGFNTVSAVLPNGSRIIGVPANADTIRGFSSVSMMLVDEAARVPDAVYQAATPMLARANGAIWLLSTPRGRSGFFHGIWHGDASVCGPYEWTRVHSTVSDCARIPAAFLEAERASKSAADFDEEYNCVFLDFNDQIFASEDLARAFTDDVHPLRDEPDLFARTTSLHFYIGLDLGKYRDHTALTVLEHRVVDTGRRNPLDWTPVTESSLACRHIDRVPLLTPYDQVVSRLAALMERAPLPGRSTLIVDATGPGAPVVDQIRKARVSANLVGVSITSGGQANFSNGLTHVPKPELLSNLQLMFQNGRLTVSNRLPLSRALHTELLEMRTSSVHHGDIAMALALAAWQARKAK